MYHSFLIHSSAHGHLGSFHVRCVLEGLRQACAKPVNHGKLANTVQEEKEAPGKFLDRLKEALLRFTEIDPESEEEKVCCFFLPEYTRPLSPWGPLDFLSTCLGNDSLKLMLLNCGVGEDA